MELCDIVYVCVCVFTLCGRTCSQLAARKVHALLATLQLDSGSVTALEAVLGSIASITTDWGVESGIAHSVGDVSKVLSQHTCGCIVAKQSHPDPLHTATCQRAPKSQSPKALTIKCVPFKCGAPLSPNSILDIDTYSGNYHVVAQSCQF